VEGAKMKKYTKKNVNTAISIARNYGYEPISQRTCNSAHVLITFKLKGGANIKIIVSSNSSVKNKQINNDILKAHKQFNGVTNEH